MERRVAPNGVVLHASPRLERGRVRHGFSTRIGGRSPAPFDSLNLGNPSGCDVQDDFPRIYENFELFQAACGLARLPRCWVHQVHGGDVVLVKRGEPFENGPRADALVSDDATRIVSVRVADCVPVLIASEDASVVAAVHAGWRGVIAGVVPNALQRLRSLAREQSIVVAAIGPAIGFDAFEVGPEVLAEFERAFGGNAPIRRRDDGKGHVDLRAAIRSQLLAAEVSVDHIDVSDRCTFRDADEFFSHRRDRGVTGRMAAIIAPSAG
jgi:YfiH family protein